GTTLLHEASATNLVKMVDALLSKSDHVNTRDDRGDSALHHAARRGHEEIAQVLCIAGADLRAKNKYGETPMLYAARYGQCDTPLHAAITNSRDDVAFLLLNHGADPSRCNTYGQNALHL
ncbi:ankyrin, partial [Aspergillus steynii IBT 23096]